MLIGRGSSAAGPQGDLYYEDVLLLLKFEGDDGDTTTTDSSTYNHTVTVIGDAEISTTEAAFDGSSSYILGASGNNGWTSTSSPLNQANAEDFTVEMWMYLPATGVATATYFFHTANSYFDLYIDTFERLTAYHGNKNNIGSVGGVPTDQWTHIAAARDGQYVYVYIDGVLDFTIDLLSSSHVAGTGTNDTSGTVNIGTRNSGAESLEDAYLDDVRWTQGVCRYPGGTTFTPQPRDEGDEYYESVILLLKGEDGDGSITTTDSSTYNHTMIRDIGDFDSVCEVDTSDKKYGTGSLLLNHDEDDGTGWTSWNADDAVFDKQDATDFTVECWMKWDGSDGGNGNYLIDYRGGGIKIIVSGNQFSSNRQVTYAISRPGSSDQIFASGANIFPDATWCHIAFVRDGNMLYGYIDGVSVGTPKDASTRLAGLGGSICYVGSRGAAGSSFPGLAGAQANSLWLDDVRITEGICRYPGGTSFTPPDSAGESAPRGFPTTTWKRYQG